MTDSPEGVRGRILAAARAEFALRGEDAASVRVIADHAGATAAMINYYFGGKRALYDAVVQEAQSRLFARLTSALAGDSPAELAPAVTAAYFDFLAEERELQRVLLRAVFDSGERGRELGEKFVRPLRQLLLRHFKGRDDALQLAISLFGAVAGYFLYEPLLVELLGGDPFSKKALAERRRHVIELAKQLSRKRKAKKA